MKLSYLEIQGFRAFGRSTQRIDLQSPLVVVVADNSQGKTSFAEALEFLFTGATTRRLLLGGSPSEFEDSLRNVHLAISYPVYVELGIEADDGALCVVRRELTSDYRGASDCKSQLTIDGIEQADVTSAGLPLSDPPLSAPVLLEHTLRYAVSSKPGERSDYFKALLEVADLEVVKAEIADLLAERESAPQDEVLASLSDLVRIPLFQTAVSPIRSATTDDQVENALRNACNVVAPPGSGESESLADAASRLQVALQTRQLQVLPVAELRSQPPAELGFDQGNRVDGSSAVDAAIARFEQAADAYVERVRVVDSATAEVLPLLRVALQTPTIAAVVEGDAITCPVCQSPGVITAERVEAIRRELASSYLFANSKAALQETITEISNALRAGIRQAQRAVPAAHRWSAETRAAHIESSGRLGVAEGRLDAVLMATDALADTQSKVADLRKVVEDVEHALAEQLDRMQLIGTDQVNALSGIAREVDARLSALREAHSDLASSVEQFVVDVTPALEAGTDTAGWTTLLNLTTRVSAITTALARHRNRARATARLQQVVQDVEAGSQKVLDQRLGRMGNEIGRWWNLLRPDELTSFAAISRKGTGKRYLDVTAALAPQPTAKGVVRNALAVFSNSQLNALGLSAFLARCTLLRAPVVLLDDPVPGSDREHRSTFASSVVGALLDDGRQVIVTTHDGELARQLHMNHQHLGVDEFEAVLSDPRDGTQVLKTGDDFERLMLDASSQMHSPLVANRRAAGNSLRIAAERLAKHVAVAGRRRAGDATAAITDYDNKNLKDLRPVATQYALKENEPGQWQLLARLLNDADHDTLNPPVPAELKNCYSTLRNLKREHLANDASLMRQ